MSFLTFGTSEKKNRAKIPATAPKEPAVTPLGGPELSVSYSSMSPAMICGLALLLLRAERIEDL